MPGVPLDALAQVKRGLRSLFGRRKKKKQPTQPEPPPSSNAHIQTATAVAASPVEAPATSNRSVTQAEDALENEERLHHPPPHPAADITPATAVSLMPDPPPATTTAPLSSGLPASQHHIAAPSQIEEAKEIDLNPARDIKTGEGGGGGDITTESHEGKNDSSDGRPKLKPDNETGMSATSGPMGDHMAEVWRDSDVGFKEGRPEGLEGEAGGLAQGAEGEGEGGEF